MIKLSPKGWLAAGGIFSLLTAVLVYTAMQDDAVPTATKAAKTVVVASKDIAARSRITADDIKTMEVSADGAKEGALSEPGALIGAIAKSPISKGEQLTEQTVMLRKGDLGMAGSIPGDKRAITIAVNSVTGVGGFVRPGDFVDVIASMKESDNNNIVSKVIVQDVEVLAAGSIALNAPEQASDGKAIPPAETKTVTLAVTLDEAQRLVLFKEDGTLALALRPFDEKGKRIALGRDLADVMGSGILKRSSSAEPGAPPSRPPVTYAPSAPSRPATTYEPSQPSQPRAQKSSGSGITVYRGAAEEIVPVK